MEKKLFFFVGVFCLSVFIFSSNNANANTWVKNCDILHVQYDTIRVTCPTLTAVVGEDTKGFFLRGDTAKEALAVALTAVSLGRKVWIRIMPGGSSVDVVRITE